MNSQKYFPVLKTKDAELRAIANLSENTASKIMPIYELTKSRISKNNEFGDISKRLSQIGSIQKKRPFILDVTTDESQKNHQTESILDPSGGYKTWRETLNAYPKLNICPAIHINFEEDEELENTKKFLNLSTSKHSQFALRLPCDLELDDYEFILEAVYSELNEESKLFILLDEKDIRAEAKKSGISSIAGRFEHAYNILAQIAESSTPKTELVCIAGSFPASPAQEAGGENFGKFTIYEHGLYTRLKESCPIFKFGDYGSININQTEIRGGTFIPRIDFCDDRTFYYHRYRRHEGSYIKCAQNVRGDANYKPQNTWGDREIALAAAGTPSGISPSFWISVRVNNYMTRRAQLLSI